MPDLSASTRLIVGLGNPGGEYADTRHNVGFRVVEELTDRFGGGQTRLECNSLVVAIDAILLASPQTYMNRSGYAVRCLAERHGFDATDVLVVYDEVALPLPRIRLRPRGGAGGHKGMESVIHSLRSEEVPRLRLGVGPQDGPPDGEDLADFVLAEFEATESEDVRRMIERAADACQCWLEEGAQAAMDRHNG